MKVQNVILIVSDTLRRDHLGVYGNTWIRTPSIDRLGKMSSVMDRYYLHNFPTVPARTDMFTGRYTSAYLDWQPLSRDETVLASVLGDAGVTTFLVGDTYNLFRDDYNFVRGFTGFEWVRGGGGDRWRTAPKTPKLLADPKKTFEIEQYHRLHLRNIAHRFYEEDYAPSQTMRLAAQWLQENYREGPFFLHVDTFDPHEPWDPPQWYTDMYDPGYTGEEVTHPHYGPCAFLTAEELKHCRALYAGEVSLVDTWVGYLLRQVENLGLLDNTAIIFLSDHGTYLGERGWINKGFIHEDTQHFLPLYEEVAHVPAIVYVPGVKPGRLEGLAQPVDLAPTIYELLGVEAPPTVQGASWVGLLSGERQRVRDFAWGGASVRRRGRYRPSMITDGEWSLIFSGETEQAGEPWWIHAVDGLGRREILPSKESVPNLDTHTQLYHLPTDPQQQRNVLSERRDVASDLHGQYLRMLEGLGVPEEALELRRRLT